MSRLDDHNMHADGLLVLRTNATDAVSSPIVAHVHTASEQAVEMVLAASEHSDDGRSQFMWLRFPDGTLALGVFPQGDTYFAVEADAETPAWLLPTDVRAAAETAIDAIDRALGQDLAAHLTCTEIDAVADLYRALDRDPAEILAAHAKADTEPGDRHGAVSGPDTTTQEG